MIGLGVGIDYALFIVTRYREHLHAGMEPEQATIEAGRLLRPRRDLRRHHRDDLAARPVHHRSVVRARPGRRRRRRRAGDDVGVDHAAAGAARLRRPAHRRDVSRRGHRRRRLRPAWHWSACSSASRSACAARRARTRRSSSCWSASCPFGKRTAHAAAAPPRRSPANEQFWYRWSRFIQHRPWPPFVGRRGVLVALALPLFSIRLGFGDTGNLPEDKTVRTPTT